MRNLIAGVCFAASVLLFAAVSRGDDPPLPEEPTSGSPEPITGEPVVPNPGSEQPRKDPFEPYGIGVPIEEAWTYEQLSASEKAIADHGMSDDHSAVNAGYASAVRERAAGAKANHAAQILGIGDVGGGVVP